MPLRSPGDLLRPRGAPTNDPIQFLEVLARAGRGTSTEEAELARIKTRLQRRLFGNRKSGEDPGSPENAAS